MSKRVLDPGLGIRLLEPGPVVLVTSMYRSHPNVMTAAWISPLGFDPPTISIAIHPGRFTHQLISRSEMFGISVPTLDLIRAVHQCGLVSGQEQDKFELAQITPIDPHEIDAPRIHECVAHLECGVRQRISSADHDLFIAEILTAEADDQYFQNKWHAESDLPLVNHIAADTYAGLTRGYAVDLDADPEEN
jgi:flavin reductase (DIM6/NTAB) family NADH-FMN oxidoreductase RutF